MRSPIHCDVTFHRNLSQHESYCKDYGSDVGVQISAFLTVAAHISLPDRVIYEEYGTVAGARHQTYHSTRT